MHEEMTLALSKNNSKLLMSFVILTVENLSIYMRKYEP